MNRLRHSAASSGSDQDADCELKLLLNLPPLSEAWRPRVKSQADKQPNGGAFYADIHILLWLLLRRELLIVKLCPIFCISEGPMRYLADR